MRSNLQKYINSFSHYILGANADCYSYDTSFECRDTFLGKPVTLDVDVKSCQRPVVVDLSLEIMGLSFHKKINGDQEIPLPGAYIPIFGGLFLTVNVEPADDGDAVIKVCFD